MWTKILALSIKEILIACVYVIKILNHEIIAKEIPYFNHFY